MRVLRIPYSENITTDILKKTEYKNILKRWCISWGLFLSNQCQDEVLRGLTASCGILSFVGR